jgi:6-phosphogluconolactonase
MDDQGLLLVGCSGSSRRDGGRVALEGGAEISDGVVSFKLDSRKRLAEVFQVLPVPTASFAVLDAVRRRLFVLSEVGVGKSSQVSGFRLREGRDLAPINEATTRGQNACHISIDPTGRNALSAHFDSASLTVNPIDAEGRLRTPSHVLKISGSGPHPRQESPHPHMVLPSPDGRWIVSADMGTDEIGVYELDTEAGRLSPHQVPAARVQPGGGARHFVFDSSGRVFVSNELDSSVTTMAYNSDAGVLEYQGHTTTLLDRTSQANALCGAIRLSPDERFLYVANRGRETIAVFAVQNDGLSPVGEMRCPGNGARDLYVTDDVVYVTFSRADKVTVLFRDAKSGAIGPERQSVRLPVPMFMLPIEPAA